MLFIKQCAFDPKKEHGESVERFVRYIKGTVTEGIHIKADSKVTLDAYCDTSFAGLWNAENAEDPILVKSRTGYVITLAGCPLTWKSKLQSLVAVSAMEAEYIALPHCMRELIPLRRLTMEVGTAFGVPEGDPAIHSVMFEDNTGATALEKVPKMTPRSKLIASCAIIIFEKKFKRRIFELSMFRRSYRRPIF